MEVRGALPEDAEEIAEVDASAGAVLRETYRPTAAALANRGRLCRSAPKLAAVVDGRVVGVTDYLIEGERLRLFGLGVLAPYRRRGAARALMERLAEIGRSCACREMVLHTVRQTGNVPVFERLGFKVASEQPDEFSESDSGSPLTDVEMSRRLE